LPAHTARTGVREASERSGGFWRRRREAAGRRSRQGGDRRARQCDGYPSSSANLHRLRFDPPLPF